MDQFVNKPNHVPTFQKLFQTASKDPLAMRLPSDKARYRLAMVLTTGIIGSVVTGVYCLATGSGKVKRG
eukprot:gene3756-6282_t